MQTHKKPNSYSVTRALIFTVFGLAEIFLLFRFVLKLFSANDNVLFVQWVYEISQPLLTPFIGMFPAPNFGGGFIIEFTTLFALLIFGIAKYLILEALAVLHRRNITSV